MTDEERPVCSEALLGFLERGCEALGGSDYKKAAAEIRALRAELVECRERTLREAANEQESKTRKRLNAQVNRLYQIANQLSDASDCDTRAVDIRMAAAAMKRLVERRGRALPAPEPAAPEEPPALSEQMLDYLHRWGGARETQRKAAARLRWLENEIRAAKEAKL